MTAADVVAVLEQAGFVPFAEAPTVVMADRPVLGVAHAFRTMICQANDDGTWRAGMYRKSPAGRPGRAYDYTLQVDGSGLPLRRACLADPDELGLFLGGACSVPFGATEVAALRGLQVVA